MGEPKSDFRQQIRQWVGESTYRRGMQYVREGRLRHLRRQGSVLEALCQGQAILPYQVWARLGPRGEVLQARCTCPVGSDGRCKHVAAMLILWDEQPENFKPAPPLAELLAQWEKEDLIRLILRMVRRYPDLAIWVQAENDQTSQP